MMTPREKLEQLCEQHRKDKIMDELADAERRERHGIEDKRNVVVTADLLKFCRNQFNNFVLPCGRSVIVDEKPDDHEFDHFEFESEYEVAFVAFFACRETKAPLLLCQVRYRDGYYFWDALETPERVFSLDELMDRIITLLANCDKANLRCRKKEAWKS